MIRRVTKSGALDLKKKVFSNEECRKICVRINVIIYNS
jgi:hypothetical protein